jgi:hypothetical protein
MRSAPCLVREKTSARPTPSMRSSSASTLALARCRQMDDALRDLLGRGGDGGDLDARGSVSISRPGFVDLGRHGGAEEQRLALRGRLQQAADRRQEALVEHLVGLIEHQRLDVVEPGGALVEMVLQAARRGDEDVDATRKRGALRAVADAAEDHGDRQAEMAAIGLEAVGDLAGQFARRGQDQRAAAAARRAALGVGQAVQQRQAEGGRLAGAGLRDAEQVAPFEHGGMACAWMGVGVV